MFELKYAISCQIRKTLKITARGLYSFFKKLFLKTNNWIHIIDPPIDNIENLARFIESYEIQGVIIMVVRKSVAARVILVDTKLDFMIVMIHLFK